MTYGVCHWSISLEYLVNWLIDTGKLPFSLDINSDRLASGRSAAVNNIFIRFDGVGNEFHGFKIIRARDVFAGYEKMKLETGDLLNAVDKEGIANILIYPGNDTSSESSLQPSKFMTFDKDMRVKSFRLYKKDFGAEHMNNKEFVRNIIEAYGIPSSGEIKREMWQYKNISEGWQITYYTFGGGISEAELLATKALSF